VRYAVSVIAIWFAALTGIGVTIAGCAGAPAKGPVVGERLDDETYAKLIDKNTR